MGSTLDVERLAGLVPAGLLPGSDASALVVGSVVGLDIPSGRVQVSTSGAEPVWVPAAPFIYEPGQMVRVRRSPLDGGRIDYCEGPISVAPMVATGKVLAVGDDLLTVLVGDQEFELMYASSTYDVGDVVLVLRHATGFGVPQAVLGLAGREQAVVDPGAGVENPAQSQSRQATVSPQDSGAWRAGRGWGQWNADRYGGVKALWQGDAYGSGAMTGWAGYGDQVANLRAVSIQHMWVDVQRADSSSTAGRSVVLQGSPDGSRPGGAPSGSGDTVASPALTVNQGARVRLPDSVYEAWRTGGMRGLRTAGGDYLSLFGSDRGGALALTVQYTVVV